MNVSWESSPTPAVGRLQERLSGSSNGSTPGIARQQGNPPIDPAAQAAPEAHVQSPQSSAAAQFPESSATHIEKLPLELHGQIHAALLQSDTPYKSLVATHAFMATSRKIRERSNYFGGAKPLETAVQSAFNGAATATAADDLADTILYGWIFEHLSPNRQARLLASMRASLNYLGFASTALRVMSAPNFEVEVTYMLESTETRVAVAVSLAGYLHKMTVKQREQMTELVDGLPIAAGVLIVNVMRVSRGWSQLTHTQRNLLNELT